MRVESDQNGREINDGGENQTTDYSIKWEAIVKETMEDIELCPRHDLSRWHCKAQSICSAQIKWAPVGIGYLCPRDDEQVIYSIMLASLIGQLAWSDTDN